jgi:hypothetical protein
LDWRERIAMGTLLAATGALVDGPVPWWPTTDRVTTAEEARHFVREVHRSGLGLQLMPLNKPASTNKWRQKV